MRTWPALLTVLASALASAPAPLRALEAPDRLAAEIERWNAFVRDTKSEDPLWAEVKTGFAPVLLRSEKALHDGQRLLALHRLAAVQADLGAAAFVLARSAEERTQAAAFEREWQRMGRELGVESAVPADAFDAIWPAAVRAIGEAAVPQVRIFYEASLEYGRNTEPESGLYYVGAAAAQRQFAEFCRSLSVTTPLPAPGLRGLGVELDRLEGELVGAYRPPASIDRHPAFIRASATIKQARELDAAALRYGALYRYLDAVQRVAQARASDALPAGAVVEQRLGAFQARLAEPGVDHSLGQLFLEIGRANQDGQDGADPVVAAAIANDVLPRYFEALAPRAAPPPTPKPEVTVTLVRWPYT